MYRGYTVLFSLVVLFCCFIISTFSLAEEITENQGNLDLLYKGKSGVELAFQNVEVLHGSTLYLVTEDWSQLLFALSRSQHLLQEATIEEQEDKKTITIPLRAYNKKSPDNELIFSGTETITFLPGNAVGFHTQATSWADFPVDAEWKAAGLCATPLIGCPYTYETATGTLTGRFPLEAVGKDPAECTFADRFTKLTVESRIGRIVIEANPGTEMLMFDFRKNSWADASHPVFWMGIQHNILNRGEKIDLGYTLYLPETGNSAKAKIPLQQETVETTSVKKAYVGHTSHPAIIPKPVAVNYTEKKLKITKSPRIYVGANPSTEIKYAAAFLEKDLRDIYGLHPIVIDKNLPSTIPTGAIILGSQSLEKTASALCMNAGLETPSHDEGYALSVTEKYAAISANTPKGAFYGVTTLVQLIEKDESGLYFNTTDIEDYPTLEFRGIHCFTSSERPDEVARAVRDLMARYKINTLVLECEHLAWDSTPELADSQWSMKKSDAERIAAVAKENFVEVIPLVQSLGHCQWMFHDGHNLDLAEDPETPYAYCVTNPDTYKFIFSIFQEALDLFQPKRFHIGHDEVAGAPASKGRFPYRSKSSGKTATELFLDDTEKLHAWLTDKGVEVMMWGDMFLARGEAPDATVAPSQEEAKARRDRLPKDITITDWHYVAATNPKSFKSLALFKEAGHKVIGCPWYEPVNIANQTIAARDSGIEGMLQTTWAGRNFKIEDHAKEWHQYWAYITAAHYFWSDDTTSPFRLPFYASEVFFNNWFGERSMLKDRKGFTVDLTPFANRSLTDTENGDGWLGFGPEMDLSALPLSQNRIGNLLFDIPEYETGLQAVMLDGKLNPVGNYPQAIEVRLDKNRKAKELHFLITSAYSTSPGTQAGEITVEYKNGQKNTIELIYGQNLFSYSRNDVVAPPIQVAWKGQSRSGADLQLWDLCWQNPEPREKINSIRIESAGTEVAPIILGITGVK